MSWKTFEMQCSIFMQKLQKNLCQKLLCFPFQIWHSKWLRLDFQIQKWYILPKKQFNHHFISRIIGFFSEPFDQIKNARTFLILEAFCCKNSIVTLFFPTDSPPQSLSDLPQTSCAYAPIVLHMHKKFEVNRTKIKGGCQWSRKVRPLNSQPDLPLIPTHFLFAK